MTRDLARIHTLRHGFAADRLTINLNNGLSIDEIEFALDKYLDEHCFTWRSESPAPRRDIEEYFISLNECFGL